MSKYIIDTDQFEKLFETKAVAVLGIGDNLAVPEEGEKTVWTRMLNVADLEELNSDYINEHFGDLQDTAYKKGLEEGNDIGYKDGVKDGQNDAWECAKKLFSTMSETEIEKVFPTEWNNGGFNALINLQPQEAIAKLKAYEADEDVKRGDVVRHKNNGLTYIVTLAGDRGYVLLDSDGNFATSCITNSFEKTGKHVDIDKILEEMRHD